MQTDIDFVLQGPLYMTQKAWLHPENEANRSKPRNVLWTSPVNQETGVSEWLEWCKRENFRLDFYENQRWHVVPHDDCKILTVSADAHEVQKYVMKFENEYAPRLDFEAIAKEYDALYVPDDTMCKHNNYLLQGWDVATCIFFKPKYTVMNDETYALLKAGKIKPEEKNAPVAYNPEVNLLPHTLPPFKFKQPEDNSVVAAVAELRDMAKKHSKRRRSVNYSDAANLLAQEKDFACFTEKRNYEYLQIPEIAGVLLKHGMDPNLKLPAFGRGYPISDVLARDNESLKLFLQYGHDPNAALKTTLLYDHDTRALKLCLCAGADPNFGDDRGVTPLMLAYHPTEVEWLLAAGANPLATDKAGRSVKDYQNGNPIYNFRIINGKMLDIAAQNLYINDKLVELRKNTNKKAKEVALDTAQKPKITRWQEKIKADKKANSLG